MMKEKEMILRQSYISVIAKASLTMYEQRIILMLVKWGQKRIEGISLAHHQEVLEHNFNLTEVVINIADIFTEGTNHYDQVIKAAQALSNRKFTYINGRNENVSTKWVLRVSHNKRTGQMVLLLDKTFFDCLYNFRKGFCYYDLVRAMNLKHPQSVKFYQLVNGMKPQGIECSITYLKQIFGVSDKYDRANDFIRKYVDVAAKELKANGEGNYFTYEVLKHGNKITSVRILPVKRATSEELQRSASGINKWMPHDFFAIMVQHAGFTTRQINANSKLLERLVNHPLGMNILLDIITRARRKRPNNMRGYIINAIKDELTGTQAAVKKLTSLRDK